MGVIGLAIQNICVKGIEMKLFKRTANDTGTWNRQK